ncbi:hypothetical protein ACHAWF_016868 [Thalassiosira exigua]
MMSSASSKMTFTPISSSLLLRDSSNSAPHAGKKSRQISPPVSRAVRPALPPSGVSTVPKKPMRPLTAYHIFFQIEREFVIQTTAGDDADKSIHDNKVYLSSVPRRYRNIKLHPQWYAAPGKRKKRKHRKQHGKIGFLELSQVISRRWAVLEEVDPETKGFVQNIAQEELDEYYREMKEYKELMRDIAPGAAVSAPCATSTNGKKNTKKRSSNVASLSACRLPMGAFCPRPEMIPSSIPSSSFQALNFMPNSIQLKNEIDHFLKCIDSDTQHLLSPASGVGQQQQIHRKRKEFKRQDSALSVSQFDPLVDMSCFVDRPNKKLCLGACEIATCVSPSYSSDEVDLCDNEILQLWKAHN